MSEQLSLTGFPTTTQPTDRLFFGIFPDAATVTHLTRLAQQLRTRHGLAGKPLAPERFHVTLFHLGDYVGLPEGLAKAASEAAATVMRAPFDVGFDQAGSFAGRARSLPFVLRGEPGVEKLKSFQQALGDALKKAGLGRHVTGPFTPHVTLLYDAQTVPVEAVEPVGWTVREFILVHSLLGQTRHIPLGRWPLRG